MFNKFVSEALGTSDIGEILEPKDFSKSMTDDYIFTEKNEKIYFLIRSKKDEYCFTNLALIHLDGESAISSKRMLKRYTYRNNKFENVALETAGTIDLDVEIKFNLGEKQFSIDVKKAFLDKLKDLYKALYEIGSMQYLEDLSIEDKRKSLEMALEVSSKMVTNVSDLASEFEKMAKNNYNWLTEARNMKRVDFGEVFETFINN